MNRQERMQTAVVLGVFAFVFVALTVSSYTQKSGTWDETAFVATGYVECRLRDYRLIPEHPPLLRMWSALPLLLMRNITVDTNNPAWAIGNPYSFSHKFLYEDNDADRLLYRARFMTVLLGVLLGVLLFSWVRDWYGFWPAVGALALYTGEPNILAHAGLATTDLGVTCFIFGTLYFLWRTTHDCTVPNVLGLTTFLALAEIGKFIALLLWPIVLLGLLLRVCHRAAWPRSDRQLEMKSRAEKTLLAAAILMVLVFGTWLAIWGIYGFRYEPMPDVPEGAHFQASPKMHQVAPRTAALMDWVDEHHLLPNTYAQGLVLRVATIQERPAYLMGQVSSTGWWYYFPFAFLVKTPVAILVLFLGAIVLCIVRRETLALNEVFILVALAVGTAFATKANLNIGLRHILPLYPLVLVLCGKSIAGLARRFRPHLVAGLLAVAAALQGALVWPDYLAYFNVFAGGPGSGHRWLLDSNLDWGQDLKPLKKWMDRNNVQHVNLSYFGTADPAYYHINCTHLRGAPFFVGQNIAEPQLPGYVAVSIQNLYGGIHYDEKIRAYYRPLLERAPVTVIGHSIYVYWVDRPWWEPPRA